MTKRPQPNMQRRGLIPAQTGLTYSGEIDGNRNYTGKEVARLLNAALDDQKRMIDRANRDVYSRMHQAYESNFSLGIRWSDFEDHRRDLSEVVTRILTKVDCLRGFDLAEKLQGELGHFSSALNEMLAAWQRLDPEQEKQFREENADLINEFAEGLKAVLAGQDLQAERLRAVAVKMVNPNGRYSFPSLDKRLSHSRMDADNEYIAEQAIKLNNLYRGKNRVTKMIDDLRAIRQHRESKAWTGSVEEAALRKLETYQDMGESGLQMIRNLVDQLKKER